MRAPITDKHLLEMMWERFPEIMKRGIEQPAQRPWSGLTDEEIEQSCVPLGAAMLSFTEVARAIEAKLRSKNNG